jgi:hypothetical protein
LSQGTGDRDEHGQAAAVVADTGATKQVPLAPDTDIGSLWEDRVQMSRQNQVWLRGGPGALREQITGSVNTNVAKSHVLKPVLHELTTSLFPERRSRYFTEMDLIFNCLGFVESRALQSRFGRQVFDDVQRTGCLTLDSRKGKYRGAGRESDYTV